ncbi:adenylate kinase [Botrimarina sp.]|uniref:adenylate kinase n=1 Tax=Botrimarina sp. TaxID=2795802 RepID=UPI0032EE89C1
MRVVFIGPPGAGKGTQSIRIANLLGVTHLSTGEVLRSSRDAGDEVGAQAAEYLSDGRLVPDDVVMRLVTDRLSDAQSKRGYVFDGFPRTLPQAKALDKLLSDRGAPLDAAIQFVVPEDELLLRLTARGREDDTEETIRERLRFYNTLTTPLVEYYEGRGVLRRIDAVGSPDEVFDRVREALDTLRVA